jgi:hypothetical protein
MSPADSKPAIFEHVLLRSYRFGKERLSVLDVRANASLEASRDFFFTEKQTIREA